MGVKTLAYNFENIKNKSDEEKRFYLRLETSERKWWQESIVTKLLTAFIVILKISWTEEFYCFKALLFVELSDYCKLQRATMHCYSLFFDSCSSTSQFSSSFSYEKPFTRTRSESIKYFNSYSKWLHYNAKFSFYNLGRWENVS